MAETSKIAWTHATMNPWIGCSKVHEGCTNCYAEAFAKRTGKAKWGPEGTRTKTSEAYWREPLKWNRDAEQAGERRRVFCASLADVFEDWHGPVHDHLGVVLSRELADGTEGRQNLTLQDIRRQLFALIDQTPWLDWLMLTKRPENIKRMWPLKTCCGYDSGGLVPQCSGCGKSLVHRENVWLGTSVSNQATADKMLPELLKCRDLSPVLFASCEPLLGPVDLAGFLPHYPDGRCLHAKLDWAIVGGESGGKRRPCEPEWLTSIVEQCKAVGVSCFVKQDAAMKSGEQGRIPDDVWAVKEFPKQPAEVL